MAGRVLTVEALKPCLQRCGYGATQLRTDYRFDGGKIPLAAFSGPPCDTGSACINVVETREDAEPCVADVRKSGAPVVFACCRDRLEWWKQTTTRPEHKQTIKPSQLNAFFREHKADFSPDKIYEAKTRARLPGQAQLHFVDVGLMPMIERNMGEDLSRLVERLITDMESSLGEKATRKQDVQAVFKSAFWLLAAKLLRDKDVPKFKKLDLSDIDDVFRRVGRHYGDTRGLPPRGRSWRTAIEKAASTVEQFAYLGSVSTEALAYLYENTLIPKEVRKVLGIHSTPSYLVNYMVWQLWPWIEEIAEEDRHVFEPACGHSAFLVGAMRQLRQWSSINDGKQRHDYLRSHLHGLEIDGFALEIAKLSLTLADIPHGNSWDLEQADMFDGDALKKRASGCRILLANPPYERFSASDKARYSKEGAAVTAQTKAVEMLTRTIPHLPRGSVFGVIVPQGALHSSEAAEVRELLVSDFEIAEIDLFADKLFEQSDHETAVILGRRKKPSAKRSTVRYRRVREKGMDAFRERFAFSSEQSVHLARFASAPECDMRLRELDDVWGYLEDHPRLSAVAAVGQGLIHHGKDLPPGEWTVEPYRKGRGVAGFADVPSGLTIFSLPTRKSLNLDRPSIRRPVTGTTTGIPQVLLNYARISRDAWRLKAVLDTKGHAVTSRFLTLRPKTPTTSLEYIWALLNSPVANAFAYCESMKRDVKAGTMREMPIPRTSPQQMQPVVEAALAYLNAAEELDRFMQVDPNEKTVREALLRMDAEVLRLYDLPPRLERQLLDLFDGVERKGVGCEFPGYYPKGLDAYVPLHELISESYDRSTLDAFLRRHKPTESPEVLAALRGAAEAYGEE